MPAAAPQVAERWRRGRAVDWAAMPMVVFNEKDALQHDLLAARGVDVPPVVHRVPTSADFLEAVCLGLGWGMLPDAAAHPLARRAWSRSAPGCTSTSRSTGSAGGSTRPCSTASPTSYDGPREP